MSSQESDRRNTSSLDTYRFTPEDLPKRRSEAEIYLILRELDRVLEYGEVIEQPTAEAA